MSMKINKLEIENVKRVKAVKIEPSPNGLTIIGGKNNQGKTSVLNAIAWALGGDHYRPSEATREGSVLPPTLHIVMNNGLVVERKGKNSDLKVTDPTGKKAGQQLLNEFVEQLALDLPRFMEANNGDKSQFLRYGPYAVRARLLLDSLILPLSVDQVKIPLSKHSLHIIQCSGMGLVGQHCNENALRL